MQFYWIQTVHTFWSTRTHSTHFAF